jgi:hypothetical protein
MPLEITQLFVAGLLAWFRSLRTGKVPSTNGRMFKEQASETELKLITALNAHDICCSENFKIICALLSIEPGNKTCRYVSNLLTAINDSFERTYCWECNSFVKQLFQNGECDDCALKNELKIKERLSSS